MQPLFVPRQMEKVAARTKLSSNVLNWGTEILDAVYAELPFMRSYMLDVDVDRRDEGTGTGVGKVTIYPTLMSKEAAAEAKKLITLPIVIRRSELSPFDTYTHDEALHPMDPDDVMSILHQADLFAAPVTAREAKKDLAGLNLYPPASMGESGTDVGRPAAMAKTASLLELVKRASVQEPPPGPRNAVEAHVGTDRPDVLQISGGPGAYFIKMASRKNFKVVEVPLADDALLRYGHDVASQVERRGYATAVVGAQPVGGGDAVKVASAATAGAYLVSSGGREVPALVFPTVMTLSGRQLSHTLVLADSGRAEIDKVAGVRLGDAPCPEPSLPSGRVVPVVWEQGAVTAYEPLEFTARAQTGGSVELHGKSLMTGQPVHAVLERGIRKVAHIEGDSWVLPFPTTGKEYQVAYLPYPEKKLPLAPARYSPHAEVHDATLTKVAFDGSAYFLRGPGSERFPEVMDRPGAVFALGVLGLAPDDAESLLKTARVNRHPVAFRAAYIPEDAPLAKVAASSARVQVSATSLKDLLEVIFDEAGLGLAKRAGVNLGADTPSNLLALDFVTPENALLYVNFLSDLEKCASQLAELLVASRLGYDDIRESATKNAMTQVQSVIRDLQQLRDKVR